MGIKCFNFSCRAICPDFFVGQEAWKLSNDWASFDDWLKTRNAGKIDKYKFILCPASGHLSFTEILASVKMQD